MNPREDISSASAVAKDGNKKLDGKQLAKLKRQQAAHENSIENFPFFAAGVVFAQLAGVEQGVVNRAGLVYTVVRGLYLVAYAEIEEQRLSYVRSALWWVGNVTVLRLVWAAGRAWDKRGLF